MYMHILYAYNKYTVVCVCVCVCVSAMAVSWSVCLQG
jgi:hypothetical protein